MKTQWEKLIAQTHPGGDGVVVPGLDGRYPLLGEELPHLASPKPAPSPWKIRLALCSDPTNEQLHALTEDVEEIRLGADCKALINHASFQSSTVYLDFPADREPTWSRSRHHAHPHPPLSGWRSYWSQGDHTSLEQTVEPDSLLLRNIALLGKLQNDHPEVKRWVVRSSVSATSEAEGLITDTLGYLAGALSGVQVLEVEQQPDESFDTLWARLNILRLLRWEAELENCGDVTDGAGLFAVLAGLEPSKRST